MLGPNNDLGVEVGITRWGVSQCVYQPSSCCAGFVTPGRRPVDRSGLTKVGH